MRVFRLRWEHIQWEMRSILVPYGNTRKARRFVPMTNRVMTALAARRKGQTEGWIFPSKRRASAGHMTTVARAFRSLCRKLGLNSKLVLYSARHTFGTRVLAATGNLAAVMKAMGHASAQNATRLHRQASGGNFLGPHLPPGVLAFVMFRPFIKEPFAEWRMHSTVGLPLPAVTRAGGMGVF